MEKVDVQGIVDNMFQLMFTTLLTFGGVSVEILGSKFISMDANGCSVFLRFKSQCDYFGEGDNFPFMMGLHYFVHYTNFAMLVLSKLSLVIQLEVLLQVVYAFFFH
jgi:hypothetical protein